VRLPVARRDCSTGIGGGAPILVQDVTIPLERGKYGSDGKKAWVNLPGLQRQGAGAPLLDYQPLLRLEAAKRRIGDFHGDALCHLLDFIGGLTPCIASCSGVSHACQRDRPKTRNVVAIRKPIKAIDTVRRLETDCHAGLTHGGVKVASDRMLHRNVLSIRS
jgi:hypothetical protein